MYPPHAPATTFVPVVSDANAFQLRAPAAVLAIHVAPESDDVYKYSPFTPPTIFVHVLSDVKVYQRRETVDSLSTQLAPKSYDV